MSARLLQSCWKWERSSRRLYEEQRHPQALSAARDLLSLDKRTGSSTATQNLLTLYRLNQGPIATTLENKREPFLPVNGTEPGKNMYPWGARKEPIESFLTAHPEERDSVLDLRSVVRRATPQNLRQDSATLGKYPALSTLHPGLEGQLKGHSLMAAHRAGMTSLQPAVFTQCLTR